MTIKETRKKLVKVYQDLGKQLDEIDQELVKIQNESKLGLEVE